MLDTLVDSRKDCMAPNVEKSAPKYLWETETSRI
jgi:hypothetical protein